MIKGLGISPGIALANVFLLEKHPLPIPENTVSDIEQEILYFRDAHRRAVEENSLLYHNACKKLSKEDAAIFLAHKEILEDDFSLISPVIEVIRRYKWNSAKAADHQLHQIITMFESMDNEYMKARASDARDIRERLLKLLLGIQEPDLGSFSEDTIIAAYEITPSDTARMDLDRVVGFISENGDSTSHSAIIARNLAIPAVSQIPEVNQTFKNKIKLYLDGTAGIVETEITDELLSHYESAKWVE